MKKQLLASTLILASALSMKSQAVIFSENFNAVPVTSNTGAIPAGWVMHNVDGNTPVASRAFMGTNAWVVRNTPTSAAYGKWATSCSWYSPAGIANDWLVTPAIALPAGSTCSLTFEVKSNSSSYLDGYEVYVSTTGTAVADFGTTPVYAEAAAPAGAFTKRAVSLAAYAGQTVYIAFRNNSNDKDMLFLDNILVKNIQANDIKLVSADLDRYALTNSNLPLVMNVVNEGSNTINSITVDWNDGTAHSQTITGLNIPIGASDVITHPVNINYTTVVEKTISVNITQVNGNTDPNVADNNVIKKHNTVSTPTTKNVLFEEGTGTWCGWCPRGAVAMDLYTSGNYPQFIGIAVHNADPMTVAAYNTGANFGGFPSSNVDRKALGESVSVNSWANLYNNFKTLVAPASVSVTSSFDVATRVITANVSSTFYTPFSVNDYRLGVIVVEDDVTGTTAAYNQSNYYAGGGQGVMGNFHTLPNPVPAAQMVYDHVGRALLGGYSGQVGSVTGPIIDGYTASYTFTYTLPAGYDENEIKLVGVLIDQADGGAILNSVESNLNLLSIKDLASNSARISVVPNPANQEVELLVDASSKGSIVKVYNTLGAVVWEGNESMISNGKLKINTSAFEAGNYMIEWISSKQKANAKLVVTH